MKRGVVLALQFTLFHVGIFGKEFGIVYDPDIFRNVSTLITSKGYPVEDHTVQTADGYVLSMQRIPYGRKYNFLENKKRVVYLQHGLFTSSADWVLNFPEQSLGFILADAGYDVWMGNTRGNAYSKKHQIYSTDQPEFWDYSFDEMATFDLPAMIDYILNITGEVKLYCIAHSQGSTAVFALLSDSPKYNEKVRLFIALAPVTTVGYITTPGARMAPYRNTIQSLLNSMNIYGLFQGNKFTKMMSLLLCQSDAKFICENAISAVAGDDRKQLNRTRLGVYSAHYFSGSSSKSLKHFGQLADSKQFTKYDYGMEGNMDHYNQSTPPEYDLSRITAPVALIWSMNDKFVSSKDIALLRSKLKTVVFDYQVDFSHMDYLAALDAPKRIYDPILSLLAKY